jgi:hypothetical protein
LSKILKAEVLAELLAVVNLNAKLLHEFDLPKSLFNRSSVFRDLVRDDTTSVLVLLEDVHVIVAHSTEEGGA